MSEALIHTPRPDDEDWVLFERGRDSGDIGLISQLRIDATLRRIRVAAQDMTLEKLGELSERAEEHLRIALEHTDYQSAPDALEYFHLKTKYALMQQIVFAQHAFSKKELYSERRQLLDGTYGAIAEVLEEALEKYDAAGVRSLEEKARLAGAINENTALALLDYPQKPERLAIPSDVTSDLYHATDLELYTLPKIRQTARIYHTQVKTGHSRRVRMPFGGILIRAVDMGNTPTREGVMFPTSRAIVRDASATDDEASAAHLKQATERFEMRLDQAITKADTELDALESLPRDLKNEVVNTMGRLIARLVNDNPDASNLDVSIYEP